eukprot:403343038
MESSQHKIVKPCSFKSDCRNFKKGLHCPFGHDGDTLDTQSSGSHSSQRIRVDCKKKDDCTFPNCKFVHPRDNYVPPVKETPKCRWDQNCTNKVCPFIHSTKSQKSPAFEKELEKQNGIVSPPKVNLNTNPVQQNAPLGYNFTQLGGQPQAQPQNLYTGSNLPTNGGNHGFGNGPYVQPQQMPPYQMPPQQFPTPGMSPYQVTQLEIEKQKLAIQQQQFEIEKLKFQQQLNALQVNQRQPEQDSSQPQRGKKKQENIEESVFKCLGEVVDRIGTKVSLEQIKQRSNNAIVHSNFWNGECKIKFDKNVDGWEQFQEEASQTMPFNVKCTAKNVRPDEIWQVINQFTAKHKDKFRGKKVFIISDNDLQKMKTNKHNRSDKKQTKNKQVHFFGQKAENEDVNEIKNLFKDFLKREYVSDQSIFEGSYNMDAVTKTHIYNYLKTSKQIDEVLKNQGITKAIRYDDRSQNIYVNTTYENYLEIADHLKSLFDSIQTETMRLDHNIVVHKTELPDMTTLKKKAEDKYNVLITDTMHVIEDSESHNSSQSKNKNEKKARVKYNYVPQDRDTQKKKEYEIQVTGIEAEQAIKYINKELDDYGTEEPKLPYLKPEEYETLKEQAKAISLKYKVFIIFRKPVTVIGKQSKNRLQNALEEFQTAISNIKKGNKISTQSMQLADAPNPILTKLMRDQKDRLQQIERQFQVNIKIDKDNYIISGKDDGIASAFRELSILQQQLVSKMTKAQIIQPNRIKAIKMKGAFNCEKEYGVQIIWLTAEEIKQQELKQHPGIQKFDQNAKLVEHVTEQWSYKVQSSDENYNDRHDKVNNWFDYDLHQNSQIEQHYQQCCQTNNFSVPYQIIGDQNMQRNGFTYHVFGASSNIATWKQKNTQTGFERQLQRRTLKSMGAQNNFMHASQIHADVEENKAQQKHYFGKGIIDFFWNIFYKNPNNHSMILSLEKYKKVMNQNILNRMLQIAQTKFNCSFAPGFSLDSINIIGVKCYDANKYFESKLDKAIHFEFPQSWEQIDQHILESKDLLIIPVAEGTLEWQQIENQFKVTQPYAKLQKVERIQNKKLWRNFKYAVDDITDKWGKPATTLMLYHGTRAAEPKKVFDGEQGFNMLFSSKGMWGQAIYFAQNSSYSHDYRHTTSSKTFQMFYARVLVGNYIALPNNSEIKMPPLVPGDPQGRYHDSIQGNTGGSDVFMIYANKKAYPEYLITYQ